MYSKTKIIKTFFKFNIIAALATSVDFSLFTILYKVFDVWYLASTFISTIMGGVVAFIMNRNWVFQKKDGKLSILAIKYLMVWVGSIFLNTLGLYLLVENTNLNKLISKILISIAVGIFYNFIMSNYFVFKTNLNERNY